MTTDVQPDGIRPPCLATAQLATRPITPFPIATSAAITGTCSGKKAQLKYPGAIKMIPNAHSHSHPPSGHLFGDSFVLR